MGGLKISRQSGKRLGCRGAQWVISRLFGELESGAEVRRA